MSATKSDLWPALEGREGHGGMFVKNRYALQRHVATGGMSVVYQGWDYRIERPVAIKVLRRLEAATPREIERFRREAQAAARLNHPHVVRVFDFFAEHDCRFLVMEYVEGANLKHLLRERGPLPTAEALALVEQVCAALVAAHSQGLIHRDVKPQNVLLDRQGIAKLADFGIVHMADEADMTTTGTVLGTADYIAPEQARGEPLTPASDLYSTGVMLYELLTGRLPFTGRTPLAVATQHASAPVTPPRRFAPGMSPYAEAVVLRALRKEPERRYQSAVRMMLAVRLAREMASRPPADHDEERDAGDDAEQPRGRVVPVTRPVAVDTPALAFYARLDAASESLEPRWSRLGVAGLAALALFVTILLLSLWLHGQPGAVGMLPVLF